MTLDHAAKLNMWFAPFAVAGGAGLTLAQGGPWYAGGAVGCLLVFAAWVVAEWLILAAPRDTNTDTTPEQAPAQHTPADYNLRPRYDSAVRGLVDLRPPLPEYIPWPLMRRLAYGLLHQGKSLTFAEWGGAMRRDSQFTPLRGWLREHDMIRDRGTNNRAGVELTARGRDWMETILRMYGPPPPSQRR